MAKNYFLTGATGFVGINILRALLKEHPDNKATLLVRKKCKGTSALQRTQNLLSEIFTPQEYLDCFRRIEVVEGNVTQANFGLPESEYHKLAQSTNVIFHSAASVKFNLQLDKAASINVNGTKSVLEFAQLCKKYDSLEKLNHISTAYVTGRKKRNADLSEQPDFINTYEITKFEAETLVHKYMEMGLPITIFRPSIVTCNSLTGEISKSSIVYIFLMLIARGILVQLPADEDSSLNLVPINYFIDMMFKISCKPESDGRTFNICNEKNVLVRDIFEYICKQLDVNAPEFIPIRQSNSLPPRLLLKIKTFLPYIEESHTFSMPEARQILQNKYYLCDDIYTGTSRMMKYCRDNQLLPLRKKTSKRVLIND